MLSSAWLPMAGAAASDSGFTVEDAALRIADETCVADLGIDFAFSEENLEALRNGVALTVIIDVEVRRKRRWWNETLARHELRYRIETNVLTGRYRIRGLHDRSTRNYRSLDETVEALGRLESVPLIARERLADGERHAARVRARLDIEGLPSPLRPIAWLSPQWRLDSGWFEWRIEP